MFTIEAFRRLTELKDGLWYTSRQAGNTLDPRSSDPEAVATKARLAGEIFGAWDGDQFWFPAFQFSEEGTPRPQIGELIAALPRDRDGSVGVEAALWVVASDYAFEGQSPSEFFLHEPEKVIRVALARLRGSDETD